MDDLARAGTDLLTYTGMALKNDRLLATSRARSRNCETYDATSYHGGFDIGRTGHRRGLPICDQDADHVTQM